MKIAEQILKTMSGLGGGARQAGLVGDYNNGCHNNMSSSSLLALSSCSPSSLSSSSSSQVARKTDNTENLQINPAAKSSLLLLLPLSQPYMSLSFPLPP